MSKKLPNRCRQCNTIIETIEHKFCGACIQLYYHIHNMINKPTKPTKGTTHG